MSKILSQSDVKGAKTRILLDQINLASTKPSSFFNMVAKWNGYLIQIFIHFIILLFADLLPLVLIYN